MHILLIGHAGMLHAKHLPPGLGDGMGEDGMWRGGAVVYL